MVGDSNPVIPIRLIFYDVVEDEIMFFAFRTNVVKIRFDRRCDPWLWSCLIEINGGQKNCHYACNTSPKRCSSQEDKPHVTHMILNGALVVFDYDMTSS